MSKRLKKEILSKVKKYWKQNHFIRDYKYDGSHINYSGYTGNYKELQNLVDCALRQWFTIGYYSDKFTHKLKKFLDIYHCILTNSGSSANLLAISSLTSPRLLNRRLHKGDEIITTACCFPTTVAPIIQNGFVPVFADIDISTFNIIPEQIEQGISRKTKAILVTHSFGNPVNMDIVMDIAKKYNLWVIEDSCDALGAKFRDKAVGTIGDIGTLSFYPAHHITTGEGGAVITNNDCLAKIVQSMRDWGRDCTCKPGEVSKCVNRFNFKFDDLPQGYDHKYIFTHIGYNLKMNDLNAAIGLAQINKVHKFIDKRNKNFKTLYDTLKDFPQLTLPKVNNQSSPSWFSFPFTYHKRKELVEYLENRNIQTRLIFAGNLIAQPAFKFTQFRLINNLPNTNRAMNESLFLGVYPGLTKSKMEYICKTLKEYFKCQE